MSNDEIQHRAIHAYNYDLFRIDKTRIMKTSTLLFVAFASFCAGVLMVLLIQRLGN